MSANCSVLPAWTAPQPIARDPFRSLGNAVVWQAPDGVVFPENAAEVQDVVSSVQADHVLDALVAHRAGRLVESNRGVDPPRRSFIEGINPHATGNRIFLSGQCIHDSTIRNKVRAYMIAGSVIPSRGYLTLASRLAYSQADDDDGAEGDADRDLRDRDVLATVDDIHHGHGKSYTLRSKDFSNGLIMPKVRCDQLK